MDEDIFDEMVETFLPPSVQDVPNANAPFQPNPIYPTTVKPTFV